MGGLVPHVRTSQYTTKGNTMLLNKRIRENNGTGLAALCVVIAITTIAAASANIAWRVEQATLVVHNKEVITRINPGTDGTINITNAYRVYAADDVYDVRDSVWNWHFSSGTVYAQIPSGTSACNVTLSGVRWGFLSMHKNILKASCMPTEG